MKKKIITILFAIPILLSAAPVFAALSTTPASSANFSDLQITISLYDNRRVILVDPTGIVSGDTEASHGYPYPYADGTYSASQLDFAPAGFGTYTILSTFQSENSYGSCLTGNTLASCLYMISQGSGYYAENTFDFLTPPPYVAIGAGVLGLPVSSNRDLVASVGNIVSDAGVLALIVVAMALPLFFWFSKEIISMMRHSRKRK